jgi:hypothetical protein
MSSLRFATSPLPPGKPPPTLLRTGKTEARGLSRVSQHWSRTLLPHFRRRSNHQELRNENGLPAKCSGPAGPWCIKSKSRNGPVLSRLGGSLILDVMHENSGSESPKKEVGNDKLIAEKKSLFQGFGVAGGIDCVKDIFVPISLYVKTRTSTVRHRGGRNHGEFAANWSSGALS